MIVDYDADIGWCVGGIGGCGGVFRGDGLGEEEVRGEGEGAAAVVLGCLNLKGAEGAVFRLLDSGLGGGLGGRGELKEAGQKDAGGYGEKEHVDEGDAPGAPECGPVAAAPSMAGVPPGYVPPFLIIHWR